MDTCRVSSTVGTEERGGRQCVEIPFSERRRLHLLQRKRAVLAGCSSHQKQMTLEWLASEGVWKGAHSLRTSKKLSDLGTSLDLRPFLQILCNLKSDNTYHIIMWTTHIGVPSSCFWAEAFIACCVVVRLHPSASPAPKNETRPLRDAITR